MQNIKKIAKELLSDKENIDKIEKYWKELSNKSNYLYGKIDLPKIEIQSRTGRVLAWFEYPSHLDFYKHFDKAKLVVSKQLLNMDEKQIQDNIRHEFAHIVLWKEFPSITNVHAPEFFTIYKSLG